MCINSSKLSGKNEILAKPQPLYLAQDFRVFTSTQSLRPGFPKAFGMFPVLL
jgi:hypothetical protein